MSTAVTRIERHTLTMLSKEVESALADIGNKYGLDMKYAGGEYGGSTGKLKISMSVRDNGSGVSGDKAMFEAYAAMLGVPKDSFGKTFVYKREIFRIAGVRPSAPVYPIRADRVSDGKTYFFPVSVCAGAA